MIMMSFGEALQRLLDHINTNLVDPEKPRERVTYVQGPRWTKIVQGGNCAWAFVDPENGNIYKSASWSSPAKHVRGNVFDPESWSKFGPYGPQYLR